MTNDELKTHSAKHTLNFIEDNYVEKDDDAAHYTWGEILNATRLPTVTLFAWVNSFTLLALRYAETVKDKISKWRITKINRVVAKRITEDEKLIIATLNANFTAVKVHQGEYVFAELVKLLAKNVTSFIKRYTPQEHPRIMQYAILKIYIYTYTECILLYYMDCKASCVLYIMCNTISLE